MADDMSGGRMLYAANTGRRFNDLDSMLGVQEGWHDAENPTDNKGIPTIGKGTNRTFLHPEERKYLESHRGGVFGKYVPDDLSPQEAQWFYENRRNRAMHDARRAVTPEKWDDMTTARRDALTSLFYNVGPSAGKWDVTMGAVKDGRWDEAAKAIRDNGQYVNDVGLRAEEIAQLLEEGKYPGQPDQQIVDFQLPDGRTGQIELPADFTNEQIAEQVDQAINSILLQQDPTDRDAKKRQVKGAMDNAARRTAAQQAENQFKKAIVLGAANDSVGEAVGHALSAGIEANLVLGSGVLGYVGSGIASLGRLTTGLLFGEYGLNVTNETPQESLDAAALWQRGFQDAVTYEPKSDALRNIMLEAAPTLAAIDEGVKDFWMRESLNPHTGEYSPLVATVGETLTYGLMDIAGAGAAWRAGNVRAARIALKKVREQAKEMGLSLKQEGLADSLVRYVERELTDPETGQVREAGSTIDELTEKVIDEFTAARDAKRQRWQDMHADENREWISASAAERFANRLERAVVAEGFDANMPNVSRILDNLQDIRTKKPGMRGPRPDTGVGGSIGAAPMKGTVMDVDINDFVLLRKQINHAITDAADTPEDAALQLMRRELDRWIEDEFDHIARTGNRNALETWKDARRLSYEYHKNFNENRIIRKMVHQEASPEEVKNWIFGANALGAKKEAVTTVRRLKQILGEDSEAIQRLAFESKVDLLSPILNEEPGWNQFINQWRKMKRSNPSLVKELGIDRKLMDQLENYAHVARRLPPRDHRPFILRWMTKFFATHILGHQLSRKSMHVKTAQSVMDSMLGSEKLSPAQVTKRIAQTVYEDSLPAGTFEVPRQAFMSGQPRKPALFRPVGPAWNQIQIYAALPQAALKNPALSGIKQEQERRDRAVKEEAKKRRREMFGE